MMTSFDLYRKKRAETRAINKKKIIQKDKYTDEHIKIWGSIEEASAELGIPMPGIIRTLHQRQYSSGGYGWEYYYPYLNKYWRRR